MDLIVDGIIFGRQAVGGVRRLHTEVLNRLPVLDADLRIRLVTEGRVEGDLPRPPGLRRRRVPDLVRLLRPGRLWAPVVPSATRAARRLAHGPGTGAVWHSTYYTRPERWDGAEVVTVYDMIHERFADRYTRPRDDELRRRKREAVEHADAIITISRTTADDLQATYDQDLGDRVHVVPLAPASTLVEVDPTPTERPYLLHVGGRAGYKGFPTLLEAYAGWDGRREVALVSAGRAWTDDEERAIAALGVGDDVRVVVEPDDAALSGLYRGATALVQASEAEGFGLTVLEAMAAGQPVVASRIAAAVEVGGDIPFWFEVGDQAGLRDALDAAVALGPDDPRRAAGRSRAAGHSWDATAAATLDVLRTVAP